MQSTKFQKFSLFLRREKGLPVADMFSRPFTQKETQLNQMKLKQLLEQIQLETMKSDNQIKIVLYLVKHETVFPSRKDDRHPVLADFGNAKFSNRTNEKGESHN